MTPRAVTVGWPAVLVVLMMVQPAPAQFDPAYPRVPYNPNDNQFYPPTGPGSFQQLPALANALAAEAQQLLDNLRFELYGTFEGRQLEMRAGAVSNAASLVAQKARIGDAGPAQLPAAMGQFDEAFAELNRMVRTLGGRAPRSAGSIDRLQKLAFQIRNLIGLYGPLPGGPPPLGGVQPIVIPGLPCSIRSLADATANLRIATNNYTGTVQSTFRPLADSAQMLNNQVRYFQGLQSSAVQFPEIQQACQQLRLSASDINVRIGQLNPPPPVFGAWSSVLDSLNRVTALLNIPGPLVMPSPGTGVIVPPPVLPPGPFPGPGPGPRFLRLLGQVLAESDGFLEGISANAAAVPGGFQFVADARNLRGALLSLDQQARLGAPRGELLQTMAVAQRFTNAIQRRIARVAKGRIGPNIARFQDLAAMIDQLHAMLN